MALDTFGKLEEWRPVVGFEGVYEVSSLGRIKRVGRAAKHGKGFGGGVRIGRVRKPIRTPYGYFTVDLWRDGVQTQFQVHRVVALAFLGPIPDEQEVNHKDGDKPHNTVDNLEYVTRSQNMVHAYAIGLRAGRWAAKGISQCR